ncbi:MAG TPA: hypothetical protein VKE51_08655 [Vicinamibacterales bacterium]|nr:hypothetical protein [Vicinamibacterales bacterium]
MPSVKETVAVVVRFTFNSTAASEEHVFTNCAGEVKYDDGTYTSFSGWGNVDIGKPVPGGAFLIIRVEDTANAVKSVQNWIASFIPVSPTTDASPFGPNLYSIPGSGGTALTHGGFQLDMDSRYTIKKRGARGYWDWSVLVQFTMSDDTHRSYASDPEMQVDPLALDPSEQAAILAQVKKRQKKVAAKAGRATSAKGSRGKRRR